MKFAATLLALVGSAAAFAPVSQNQGSRTIARAGIKDLPGNTMPLKNFDPLGLANLGTDETLAWFRAA